MNSVFKSSPIIALIITICTLSGCASYSQTFIGVGGEIKNCASTSQDQGIGGVMLASGRFNRCVDDLKQHGYKEIENIGAIGILVYSADSRGLRVRQVYDNSPAAKAGIIRGDIIVSINGKEVLQKGDFDAAQGEIGSNLDLVVSREGVTKSYSLVRAKLTYSRFLEDVVY